MDYETTEETEVMMEETAEIQSDAADAESAEILTETVFTDYQL